MNYNERLSGNEAIAFAMKQIDPDVMAAFPITPSTEIPQYFAQYVANGEVNTEFVPVESEHSSHVRLHRRRGCRGPGGDRHLLLPAWL